MELESTYQVWKFALPLFILATFSFMLMITGLIKRKASTGPVYYLLILNLSIWITIHLATMLTGDPHPNRILSLLEYITTILMPITWLYFAFDFTGVKGWKSPYNIAITLLVPMVLGGAALYNLPGINISDIGASNIYMFGNSVAEPGRQGFLTWTVIQCVYSMVYFLIATVLLGIYLYRHPKIKVNQALIITLGILIPWFGNISALVSATGGTSLMAAPMAYTLSGTLLAVGLNFNKSANIVAAARGSVIDRMVEGLIVLDMHNIILDMNSAAGKILRIQPANALGHSADVVFRSFSDLIDNLRYSSRKNQNLQIQVGGEVSYYLLDINPLFDKRGEVMGKTLILHDVTSLKITEIKLNEAKDRAEQSDNLKSAFLANMSHEIRTPMNVIIGFSNLLNDSEVSQEERDEFVEHIKNSGNSLLQLIDDIIDISKLDAGQIVQENSRLSITRLLAELFAFYNEQLQESGKKDIQLLVNGIRENVDWTVMADGIKINRIFRHLLSNAVKFTGSGYIEFGVKMETPDELKFYVQDSGIGIAREKQGMIFERFSRVMTGTRQEYGGTGMGLAICKGLTELMGGRIWVESNLGAGSTFYVSLPVSQVEEHPVKESLRDIYERAASALHVPAPEIPTEAGIISESAETSQLVPQDDWRNRVILVLEPEEIGYLNIEMILRQTHVNLVWVKSVTEASNYLDKKNPVNLLLSSAQLNEKSLEEALNSLTAKLPGIPSIAIVPIEGSPLVKTCHDLGFGTVVSKPIMPARLLQALRPILS